MSSPPIRCLAENAKCPRMIIRKIRLCIYRFVGEEEFSGKFKFYIGSVDNDDDNGSGNRQHDDEYSLCLAELSCTLYG